jgi:hypothetical protein
VGPFHHCMEHPEVVDGGTVFRNGEWFQIYGISSHGQPTRGGPPAWGLGEMLTTHHEN